MNTCTPSCYAGLRMDKEMTYPCDTALCKLGNLIKIAFSLSGQMRTFFRESSLGGAQWIK